MRLLFITGRMLYPFFRGGDGTTANQLISNLRKTGITVLSLGKFDPLVASWSIEVMRQELNKQEMLFEEDMHGLSFWDTGENILFRNVLFEAEIEKTLLDFQPDIVLTQMDESHTVIKLSDKHDFPVILYVHDGTPQNHNSLRQNGLTYVFYNSIFTAEHFSEYSDISSAVVYPVVDSSFYRFTTKEPDYVTMVNPVTHKGLAILEKCCGALPGIRFQVVRGWQGSDGIKSHANVEVMKFGSDMKYVYSRTRFVITPSQWEEPFCRIPVEAGVAAIPTIASNVGGLPEAVGGGGILLDQYRDSDVWVETILKLHHNPKLVSHLGDIAENHSKHFDARNITSQVINEIKKILS